MEKLPEMSNHEKYQKAFRAVRSFQERVPAFVARHLNGEAANSLISVWQGMITPVPENAPDRQKYETAFNNWLWMSKYSYEFVEEQLGQAGLEEFIQAEVEALRHEFSGLDKAGNRLLSALAPGLAFDMIADELLYEMQWHIPVRVTSRSSKMVCAEVTHCPITELPGMEQVCQYGCHQVYAGWAADQAQIRMEFIPKDSGCQIVLVPV